MKKSDPAITVFDRIRETLLAHGPMTDNDIVKELVGVKPTSTKATITRGIKSGVFHRVDTTQDPGTGRFVRRVELNKSSHIYQFLAN